MSQENHPEVANGGSAKIHTFDENEAAMTDLVDAPIVQDISPVNTSELPSTAIDISAAQISSTPPAPVTTEHDLPVINNAYDSSLVIVSQENIDINAKKYDIFVDSLKKNGGVICNHITQLINLTRNHATKKEYEYLANDPIALLKETYNKLKTNPNNLLNNIIDAYHTVNNIDQGVKQVVLPLQFILGYMLRAYKESVKNSEFVALIRKEKSISLSTCYNYINLTKVLDYIDDKRIFSLGLTLLYSLSSIIEDPAFKDKHILEEIINLFSNLTNANQALANKDELFTEDKLQLLVSYVVFYYDIGKQSQLDRNFFFQLYNARYIWTKTDVDFIKKYSIETDKNGDYVKQPNDQYQYKIKDSKFIDSYMEKIISCNFDGKRARKELRNSSNTPSSLKTTKKSSKAYTINWASEHLTETLDKYLTDNKTATPKDIELLKKLQTKLNDFLSKNTTQPNGATK